jgi:integrase/recombinase XerD
MTPLAPLLQAFFAER